MPAATHAPTAAPTPSLPTSCDVLVIGAGPAGSACAQWLARGGRQVLLADQHEFPRDKVCGDGLIPDSHAAFRRLGVQAEVAAAAQPVTHVHVAAPRGGCVDVPGRLSVLPRKQLDHILVRAAQAAGARLLAPLRFEAPLLEGERVVGARFKTAQGLHEISAQWVVLATGAVPQALSAAGLCERQTPSGIALRGYVHHPTLAQRHPGLRSQLHMFWHPRLRGGYGWVFPAPGDLYNIGTGLPGSHPKQRSGKNRMRNVNLRQMLEDFCSVYPVAGELMREGTLQGDIKGAPLRCSLQGARWSRPGLLATGEAVGSTYAFTGEGIGKAMETGLLAAEALLQHAQHAQHAHTNSAADATVQQHYEATLRALKPKFDPYETADHVNRHPWLADVVVWRARRSPRILRRLSGMLEETQDPSRLFSLRGVAKLLFE